MHGLLVVAAVALSACASGEGEARNGKDASTADARIESCIDRLLRNANSQDTSIRSYVRKTYCERFEQNGWIYHDGALRIAAHTWLEEGGTCATQSEGEPPRTVPCDELEGPGPRRLDCAVLHHVRRSEVRAYIARRQRQGPVECDDGSPLESLGVP
jgi:hypothetical protein